MTGYGYNLSMMDGIKEVNLPLRLLKKGKVRDIYEYDSDLLIVCTDRVSAFDVVMDKPIPDKGRVLNLISAHFFDRTKEIIRNHLITTEIPNVLEDQGTLLKDRIMIVKKAEVIKVECVVRGYLAGSAWAEYREKQTIFGKNMGKMLEADQFKEPIFTPSTKAESGHDLPLDRKGVIDLVGGDLARRLEETSINLYQWGRDYLEKNGVIIADTKFEFGILDGETILIDEIFTPDSSRFWLKADYQPGKHINPLDKQFLRDYLISTDWNRSPPPPPLPLEVIKMTRARYLKILKLITGQEIDNN